MSERKTNLFVVGAMKAGTTSFVELLSEHPQIYCPPVKEPHYFVDHLPRTLYEPGRFFRLNDYLEKEFPKPLHITKIETEAQYQQIYSLAASEKYRADTSTAYLHTPESAQHIQEYNPDAKIIILLRDPLRRAFSHYKMDVGKGRVNESFQNLMQQNISEYEAGTLLWSSYLGMSLYSNAIERYQKLFPNVLIVHFEALASNKAQTLADISAFLSVEAFEDVDLDHKNIARTPRFPRLLYFLNRLGLKDYFSKIFSSTFKQWLSKKTSSGKTIDLELSEATRNQLVQIFRKESQI